eukprot:s79_g15.t1
MLNVVVSKEPDDLHVQQLNIRAHFVMQKACASLAVLAGVPLPQIPGHFKSGRVAVRLAEAGPRLRLLLIKAEEGVCTGGSSVMNNRYHLGVMYHRFLTKTPSQQQVLQERARQRQKLKERNARLETWRQVNKDEAKAKAKAKGKRKREKAKDDDDEEEKPASTLPKYRFEKDVFKGMNRLAQAFACFVTDRSLHELKREQTSKAKKGSKNAPVLRKTLTAEHVMRFLQQDMPQLANKLASLHPDKMPEDFKPSSVKLLKQLHEQIEAAAAVDSLEVDESFPEVPEVDFPILSPKGAKKRKAAEAAQDDCNAEDTKEKPKKATRSLSAFFTKTNPPKESDIEDAETLPAEI